MNISNKKREVAVLDLGTKAVCSGIIEKDMRNKDDISSTNIEKMRALGVGNQLAKGIEFGTIRNFEQLEDSILSAISSAEKEAGKSIKSVFIAIPTWATRLHKLKTSIDIGKIPVDEVHLTALQKFDTSAYMDDSSEIIHTFPVSYTVDDIEGIQEPQGLIGNKLSAIFHIISAPSLFLKNIKNCLNRNDIEVSGFIPSTYASALSVASSEEISMGVTIVDIGASTTSVACLKNGVLLYLDYIPLGGQKITDDIALVLKTTRSSAERMKRLYGVAVDSIGNEQILISKIDDYGEEHAQNISLKELDLIISARLEEILDKVQEHLYAHIADKTLLQSVIITGGGSQLSGLSEFIRTKRYFSDVRVRLGKPIGITGSHDFVRTPSFAGAVGVALYCFGEFAGKNLDSNDKSLWKKLILWFKRGI